MFNLLLLTLAVQHGQWNWLALALGLGINPLGLLAAQLSPPANAWRGLPACWTYCRGRLNNSIAIDRRDEIGQIETGLATMQVHIKVTDEFNRPPH